MRYLLDTHIFLWFIDGDKRLPSSIDELIRDADNEIFLSVVSTWEIIVKYQIGKLPLPERLETLIPMQRELHEITNLPLDEPAILRLAGLPSIHNDPFDRMLVCQAQEHGLTFVTKDPAIRDYPVTVIPTR